VELLGEKGMDGKILVVEDEREVRDLIAVNLQRAGFRTLCAGSVPEAEALLREELPCLVLLDWMLPDTPGVLFARRLRAEQRTADIPIIMLTARVREEDRIMGLEAGVDDYVTKPFFPRELMARIRAVIRRCKPQLTDDAIEIAGLMLNPASRLITCYGREIELGDIEFRMLHFFMTHPERVYSGSTAGRSCSTRCGATGCSWKSAPWMSTFAGCARRWSRQGSRSSLKRFGVWATASVADCLPR
jgi:two-component system, OmpR family, phosphate regulon response regulator PhoB